MVFSLDPNRNPIVRIYGLFDHPGVVPKDAKRLGVDGLDLRKLGCGPARELIGFMRAILAADLDTCRLMRGGTELVNFAGSVTEWFQWAPLTELGLLAGGRRLTRLRNDLAQLAVDGHWFPGKSPEEEGLATLEEIAASSLTPLTLEISVAKERLVQRHLLAPLGEAATQVSAFVWREPAAMAAAFDRGFADFLERFAGAAERPVALFFHRGTEPLSLDFLKILPLSGAAPLADRETTVVENLRALDPRIRAEYRNLRRRQQLELRQDVGQKFHLPPALFLRRDLAGYPDHPLLAEGPLRSLLVYSLLAWLAKVTAPRNRKIRFDLPGAGEAELDFTLSDVRGADGGLFAGSESWQEELLLLANDVHRSVGREDLRKLWDQAANETLSEVGLEADLFFDQIRALRKKFRELERKPLLRGLVPGERPGGPDGPSDGGEPGPAEEPGQAREVGRQSEPSPGTGAPRRKLLQLRVFLDRSGGGSELDFELDCAPLGWFLKNVGRMIPGSEFRYHEMSKLAADEWQRALSPVAALQTLESRGRILWEKLIPGKLRRAYCNEIRHREDLTLLIVSSDPSFPWELVCPHSVADDDTQDYSERWLAGRYRLARWLAGSPPPVPEIGFGRVCCVADGHFASALAEVDYFKGSGVELHCPENRDQLFADLRRKPFDVLHFACHGVLGKADPTDSVVSLPDGKELRPDDLNLGEIVTNFRENRPLVFLNCCHSGVTTPGLTGLGGWAASLIGLGCGAVIGCGWAVVDELAAKFSLAFYDSWRAGNDLSGAVLDARRVTKETAPGNPTWLAYYLFGNPYCTIRSRRNVRP